MGIQELSSQTSGNLKDRAIVIRFGQLS